MSFEIVDGMTGTKHISSDDIAALNAATLGTGGDADTIAAITCSLAGARVGCLESIQS